MDNFIQKWWAVLKITLGVRDTTPSWCIMRECGLEPQNFNWFRAAMRSYNSLVKGLFFPSGPFSSFDVRSSFAACVVFLSFLTTL